VAENSQQRPFLVKTIQLCSDLDIDLMLKLVLILQTRLDFASDSDTVKKTIKCCTNTSGIVGPVHCNKQHVTRICINPVLLKRITNNWLRDR